MEGFSFVDESFDPNISLSYFLSIRLNSDGLSFCTLDPIINKYIQISHFVLNKDFPNAPQLDKYFATIDILNLPFKKTFILIPTQIATLVPAGIFESEKSKIMLEFCCNISDNENVKYNKIRQADVYNIFTIPSEIETIFSRQFPEPIYFHQNTPFIDGFLSSSIVLGNEHYSCCINFNTDFFDVVIFEKTRLKLCNSFTIKGEKDFIYYILFVVEQLKLSESNTSIFISGINENRQKYITELSRYFSKIKQIELPNNFHYSHIFKELRFAGFYNLLNLPTCV